MRAGVLFGEDRIFAGAGGVVALGCEQLHKPWMLMSQQDLRSSYPTYPFPWILLLIEFWENIHPWAKGQEGGRNPFFGRGNRWMSNRRMPWRLQWTRYVWPLPSLLVGWLMSNWAASCVFGSINSDQGCWRWPWSVFEDGRNTTSRCLGTFQLTSQGF